MADGTRSPELQNQLRTLQQQQEDQASQLEQVRNNMMTLLEQREQRLLDQITAAMATQINNLTVSHSTTDEAQAGVLGAPPLPPIQPAPQSPCHLNLASRWYQGFVHDGFIRDWGTFLTEIHHRFGPSEYDDPAGNRTKLTQSGSVLDYQTAFSSKVTGLSAAFLESTFISGLKSRIRRVVVAERSRDFHDAFALACVSEEQFAEERPVNRSWPSKPTHPPTLPLLRVGHRCKGKATLLYLEGIDEEPDDYLPAEDISLPEPEISFNALLGQRSAKSLRLNGTIHSTSIQVGNDDMLLCEDVCRQVSLVLQSTTFSLDLFILDLQGADVVLGVQWLATLGPIITNYADLTMSFQWRNRPVLLQGAYTICSGQVSPSQFCKLIATNSVSSYFMRLWVSPENVFSHLAIESAPLLPAEETFQPIIDEFADVFTSPTELPLVRVAPDPNKLVTIKDWSVLISQRQFGASNQAADALSRAHDSEAPVATGQLFSLSYPTTSDIVVLEEELVQDQYAKQIIDALQNNLGNWLQWKLVGKLFSVKANSTYPPSQLLFLRSCMNTIPLYKMVMPTFDELPSVFVHIPLGKGSGTTSNMMCKIMKLVRNLVFSGTRSANYMDYLSLLSATGTPSLGQCVAAVDGDLRSRDEILSQLRSNLSKVQAFMKHHVDKRRKNMQFEPCWLNVWLSAATSLSRRFLFSRSTCHWRMLLGKFGKIVSLPAFRIRPFLNRRGMLQPYQSRISPLSSLKPLQLGLSRL
ncbi:hypothetical protein Pint_05156 [Pistacia integerrima]|uniref:Uncharacterized protein n=1 Tax=Pistacia integerrima TaxID=434235 RepID=A0ACC0Z147_9ROSI|nr:hypothetical protein Pint_05156 [Pistacia integerrima]